MKSTAAVAGEESECRLRCSPCKASSVPRRGASVDARLNARIEECAFSGLAHPSTSMTLRRQQMCLSTSVSHFVHNEERVIDSCGEHRPSTAYRT